jgi:serine/threonine-protein kinase RsbT
MNNDSNFVELARLPIVKMQDVLMARFIGRNEAGQMGFPPTILTRLATAISEITRNVVQHAGAPGEFRLGRVTAGGKAGLSIIVSDRGKGMAQPEQFLDDGKFGPLGAGLTGTRRLVDEFQLESASGAGTTVTMVFWKQAAATR